MEALEDSPPAPLRVPERRLTPADVEAVIARAIELHLREAAESGDEEIPEAALLRIGDELGLPAVHVRRALAEMDGGAVGEDGWLARHVGESRAAVSRVVARNAEETGNELESYLRGTECMVVYRRLPGRTIYTRASGLVASAARAARRLRGRHPLLRADRVEVAVQALEGDSCCVAVAIDLTRKRTEHAGAGLVGGVVAGGGPAAAAGLLVAPAAALVGLPLALGAVLAARAAYRSALREAGSRLESVLDRLEHGELAGPAAAGPRLFGL
jgi:hypothetical protein